VIDAVAAAHGTRACYQAGCRRLECRVANAEYQVRYRRTWARGRPPLGSLVRASEARRRVRQLQAEHFTKADLARRLGVRRLRLGGDVITLRRALGIRRLYFQLLIAGLDGQGGGDHQETSGGDGRGEAAAPGERSPTGSAESPEPQRSEPGDGSGRAA
jgi:hypothetical protein